MDRSSELSSTGDGNRCFEERTANRKTLPGRDFPISNPGNQASVTSSTNRWKTPSCKNLPQKFLVKSHRTARLWAERIAKFGNKNSQHTHLWISTTQHPRRPLRRPLRRHQPSYRRRLQRRPRRNLYRLLRNTQGIPSISVSGFPKLSSNRMLESRAQSKNRRSFLVLVMLDLFRLR